MKWTYEIELELQREYEDEAVCGYLRSPRTTGKTIEGKCALDNKKCNSCLPMNMYGCKRHQKYFNI